MKFFKDTFQGDSIYDPIGKASVKITTTGDFTILRTDLETGEFEVVGPMSSTDRQFKLVVNKDETIEIKCDDDTYVTLEASYHASSYDNTTSEKLLVESDYEPSMYDKLRTEMLMLLSQKAEENGLDSIQDEASLDFIDDDSETPLTPYEYSVMQEEFPEENIAEPQQSEDAENIHSNETTQEIIAENPATETVENSAN
jgi:hypothetical protein